MSSYNKYTDTTRQIDMQLFLYGVDPGVRAGLYYDLKVLLKYIVNDLKDLLKDNKDTRADIATMYVVHNGGFRKFSKWRMSCDVHESLHLFRPKIGIEDPKWQEITFF